MIFADFAEPIRYTEAEAKKLAQLAQIRLRADGGDRKAKAQISQLARQLKTLQRQAVRGNTRAARQAQVLEESGLLAPSQTFTL